MSTASLDRNTSKTASDRSSQKSYDLAILASVGIVAIGVVVAIYGLSVFHGVSHNELALMAAYP
jgi:hypothetical protein